MKREYFYEDGSALFIIEYKGQKLIGKALCHPDDSDMESSKVGLSIAEMRANIKLACFMRDFEIKPQLKILNHLKSNLENSKNYNSKSYEAKMLRSQIHSIEKELATANKEIAEARKFLKEYIDSKEKMYKRLRSKNNNSKS